VLHVVDDACEDVRDEDERDRDRKQSEEQLGDGDRARRAGHAPDVDARR
jgi:hypothetical protein